MSSVNSRLGRLRSFVVGSVERMTDERDDIEYETIYEDDTSTDRTFGVTRGSPAKKRKKFWLAFLLSAIIPGLGLLYAGKTVACQNYTTAVLSAVRKSVWNDGHCGWL